MPVELSSNFESPSLSAFISNYNHGQQIGRAIEAMAEQSRQPDELVIVDDGSTDDSVAVIREYAERYDWIRLVANRENQGVLKVLEQCEPELTGDYVYWGSSDDHVLPGFFEAAMKAAVAAPQAGIVFGQIRAEDEQGERLYKIKVGAWPDSRWANATDFRRECLEAEPAGQAFVGSTVFRRTALREVGGFRPELGSWCDSFAWRACGLRFGAYYLSFPCMAWAINPASLSHSASRRPWHMLKIIHRATKLMNSSEFRGDFPRNHVQRWKRGYYMIVLEHYLLSWLPGAWLTYLSRSDRLRRARVYWLRVLAR